MSNTYRALRGAAYAGLCALMMLGGNQYQMDQQKLREQRQDEQLAAQVNHLMMAHSKAVAEAEKLPYRLTSEQQLVTLARSECFKYVNAGEQCLNLKIQVQPLVNAWGHLSFIVDATPMRPLEMSLDPALLQQNRNVMLYAIRHELAHLSQITQISTESNLEKVLKRGRETWPSVEGGELKDLMPLELLADCEVMTSYYDEGNTPERGVYFNQVAGNEHMTNEALCSSWSWVLYGDTPPEPQNTQESTLTSFLDSKPFNKHAE